MEKALAAEPDAHDLERLTSACDNEPAVAARIAPYLGLLRLDLAELPVVYLPDSMYVTKSSDRRSSGTYYTPRVLAEEIVQYSPRAACVPARSSRRDRTYPTGNSSRAPNCSTSRSATWPWDPAPSLLQRAATCRLACSKPGRPKGSALAIRFHCPVTDRS